MLSKKEIKREVSLALGILGDQLRLLRKAARKNITTVSRETG